MSRPALLDVSNLAVSHRRQGRSFKAVDDVSLRVAAGETVGLIGESGSGKTTLARAIAGLQRIETGNILLDGIDIAHRSFGFSRRRRLEVARKMQMVFQDLTTSLNPRKSISRILDEPLEVHRLGTRTQRDDEVTRLMSLVGLAPEWRHRLPHELSGGQRQRIGIARALALRPRLVICDEPVSALDVSVQAQILNLLAALQADLGVAYLFISHDLEVVRHLADRVLVLYRGTVVEEGPVEMLWGAARHPYALSLLAATPGSAAAGPVARSRPPEGTDADRVGRGGCPYYARCAIRVARCGVERPVLHAVAPFHSVACHLISSDGGVAR